MKNVKIANEKLLEQAYNKPFDFIEEKRPNYELEVFYSTFYKEFNCTIRSEVFSSTISIFSKKDKKTLDKLCKMVETYVNELNK